ncbi:MAG: T9SS type A sorting domain-containing protein [Paludibacter sp.]
MKRKLLTFSYCILFACFALAQSTNGNATKILKKNFVRKVSSSVMGSGWAEPTGKANNMSITAKVYKNGVEYMPENLELGAFYSNDNYVYGVSPWFDAEQFGKLFLFGCQSDFTTQDGFFFKVYDPTNNKIYSTDLSDAFDTGIAGDDKFIFVSDGDLGQLETPVIISLKFDITATSANVSKGTVSGAVGTFTSGQSVHVTASPVSGYRFTNWTDGVGGTVMSTNADYTFSANESRSLVANFDVASISISSTVNASTLTSSPSLSVSIENNGHLIINTNSTFDNIVIQGGGKLTINNGSALTASSVNIGCNENGTGTFVNSNLTNIDGGLICGSTSVVQQYLTAGRNWYISSPVTNASSSVFNATSNILYYYNEATGTWPQITNNSTALTVAKGYVANMTSSTTVNFIGYLNDGFQQISITRHPGVAKEGFNLVGNPYPSFLNFESALRHVNTTNLGSSFWFRTQNEAKTAYVFDSYSALNHIGTSNNNNSLVGITADIPPMQAFWVRVADGKTTANLAFTNSMRSHKDQSVVPNRFKVPMENAINEQMVRLQVTNGIVSDEAILITNPSASNAYDAYDTQKMSNNSVSIPEIYTLADNEQVVINGLNSIIYDTEIALGFTTGQSNTFTIKASQISNFAAGTQVILLDKLLNKAQDLTVFDYSFNSDVTSTASRFSLVFKAPSVATSINSTDLKNVSISTDSNSKIVIAGAVANESSVVICNTLGQRIYSSVLTSVNTTLNPELKSGVYFVTVKTNSKNVSAKVILN